MPWTPPSDPVTSTVITVAYAVANLLTQIRWLRGMTGNADPPATNYVVVSDTTATTSWRKVPPDALATGAALGNIGSTSQSITNGYLWTDSVDNRVLDVGAAAANLGYTPVHPTGETMTGELAAPSFAVTSGGSLWRWSASAGSMFLGVPALINPLQLSQDGSVRVTGPLTVNGNQVIDTSNDGTICNAATAATATNATQLGGHTPSVTSAAGAIPIADGAGKLDAWITGGATPGPHTHSGDALLPATVNGAPASVTAGAGRIPIADPSGKLDAWVTPASFSIPSGLGMWVRTAAEIPAGFVRETSLDGLIPVGAGTTFGQTFAETASYGSTWLHGHADSGHGHGNVNHNHTASALTVAGHTGTASASTPSVNVTSGAGGETYVPDHTHDASSGGGTLDVGGSTDSTPTLTVPSGTAVISSITWLPPMRAVVWVRKT